MVRGVRRMRDHPAQPALADLGGKELPVSASAQTDAEIAQFIRNHADSIYHPVGSCRIGPGPMDVVDAQLRVHGVQGLRVVDASVMPRITSGNTQRPHGDGAPRRRWICCAPAPPEATWAASAAKAPPRQRRCQPEGHHRGGHQHKAVAQRLLRPLVHEQGAHQLHRIGQRQPV